MPRFVYGEALRDLEKEERAFARGGPIKIREVELEAPRGVRLPDAPTYRAQLIAAGLLVPSSDPDGALTRMRAEKKKKG